LRKLILLILFISLIISLSAFESKKKPLKAAALSFFIPGGGQFYNESYLKSGIILTVEGTLLGITIYHHLKSENYYNKYKKTMSVDYYQRYLNYYYKRQNDLWWVGTVILLSTIDAFVDAHLSDFQEQKRKIHLKFEGDKLSLSYNFY